MEKYVCQSTTFTKIFVVFTTILAMPHILRPPLNKDIFIEPDIIHFAEYESGDGHFPEICFGLGDYKTENYYLAQGFEKFKEAIEDFRRMDQQTEYLYQDAHWNPGILFALVLSKYFYDAFLCGTNRF